MPSVFGLFIYDRKKAQRREAKKRYWMNKGCSERKAEELLYRYGF